MRHWKPPLRPDPFYAHVFRWFLRRNSRKRAGMTNEVEALIEEVDEDEEFTWRYAPLQVKAGGQILFQVCEEYPGMGYTDAETPMGESMEELITELEMMLRDMKAAHFIGHVIVDGAPYDNWRTRELEKEHTLSQEETDEWLEELAAEDDYDIGDDPTIRMKVDDDE
jgi:hypothetical protein